MKILEKHQLIIYGSWILGVLLLILYGSKPLFMTCGLVLFPIMILRAINLDRKKRFKFMLMIFYILILIFQVVFYNGGLGGMQQLSWMHRLENTIDIFVLFLPLLVEYFIRLNKFTEFYLPSVQEINTVTFGQVKLARDKIYGTMDDINLLRQTVTIDRIKGILGDLPRHSVIRYINNGTLTDAYFADAEASLDDENIYIIVSSTGSDVSEVLSVFTRKQYNHASLSFDKDLNTIISYNGGEKVYPPGLNKEMIEFFNKKKDASMMVYSLKATREQKQLIIDRIREINEKGSAYNMLGLVFNNSMRPNIMFCSQFVYSTLKYAGLAYFEKIDGSVIPTDLIELDYHRKLEFSYEIFLNEYEARMD